MGVIRARNTVLLNLITISKPNDRFSVKLCSFKLYMGVIRERNIVLLNLIKISKPDGFYSYDGYRPYDRINKKVG